MVRYVAASEVKAKAEAAAVMAKWTNPSPFSVDRYLGWGCFFSVALAAVGAAVLGIAKYRTPVGSKFGVAVLGIVLVLAAIWLAWVAINGRLPDWIKEGIDDPS